MPRHHDRAVINALSSKDFASVSLRPGKRRWARAAASLVAVLASSAQAENTRTVRQPLVNGTVIALSTQEDFGLLGYRDGLGMCSASLLRNDWIITAAHCVEITGGGKPIPDPGRPGQNFIKPASLMTIDAAWDDAQSRSVVSVTTFRPFDIALIKVAAPFTVHGRTTGYSRMVFQDGQFPYFGEPVGAQMITFGRGINAFATGSGDSAMPSTSDGQYRVGYAKPHTSDSNLYWYRSVNGQMIGGGDSGGPSFAWVLTGYVLVGVHALTHVKYIEGKPATGWTWVSETPEAADAPIYPVLDQIKQIMGPAPRSENGPGEAPPPTGPDGVFTGTPRDFQPMWIYGIRPNGELIWYRKDSTAAAWQGPKQVGTGWAVKDVIPAGGNHLYTIDNDGKLTWYQHNGFNNGAFDWKGGIEVGNGWFFKRVFSGGDGVLYAIRNDGKLFWYRHVGYRDGSQQWIAGREVGSDWAGFKDVFSTGEGRVFAVKPDGTLLLYQHLGFADGMKSWSEPRVVGSAWNQFQQIIAAGNGVILGLRPDGALIWYRYTGNIVPRIGRIRLWAQEVQIGSGWQGFGKVVALLPATSIAPN